VRVCGIPQLASGIAVSRDRAYLTSLEVKLPNFLKSHSVFIEFQ
jgi:hypothetical protein